MSRATKPELVKLYEQLLAMMDSMGCDNPTLYLRAPVVPTTRDDRKTRHMPMVPPDSAWVTDPTVMRPLLPEIGEHIIVTHLCEGRPEGYYGARNLYRGAQRAYDLGAVGGFSAVLCPPEGGDVWIRLR